MMLSRDAQTLLDYYRRAGAFSEETAIVDRAAAMATGIARRRIFPLTLELIVSGYALLAICESPHGRFLDDSASAVRIQKYMRTIRSRHAEMAKRYRALRTIARRREQDARPADSTGQPTLPFVAEGVG